LRRDAKEMRSILPIDLALVDEPDVHLVHKGRRLQGVVGALVPKPARRHAAELRINERQQLIERSPVAATPIAEQRSDIASRQRLEPCSTSRERKPSIAPGVLDHRVLSC